MSLCTQRECMSPWPPLMTSPHHTLDLNYQLAGYRVLFRCRRSYSQVSSGLTCLWPCLMAILAGKANYVYLSTWWQAWLLASWPAGIFSSWEAYLILLHDLLWKSLKTKCHLGPEWTKLTLLCLRWCLGYVCRATTIIFLSPPLKAKWEIVLDKTSSLICCQPFTQHQIWSGALVLVGLLLNHVRVFCLFPSSFLNHTG